MERIHKFALLLLLFAVPTVKASDGDYCLVQYKNDFSFSSVEYVTDMTNGLTAQVRWGPYGYAGAILQPRIGEQTRVPVERFETYYQALNCKWSSVEVAWDLATQTLADRQDCLALVFGSEEAIFQCGYLLESFRIDEDVLGPFFRYEQRATGEWYQSAEYTVAKEELDRLVDRAKNDIYSAIIDAESTLDCRTDIDPNLIELPEKGGHLSTNLAENVGAVITFTVETDGTVSEIFLERNADYHYGYIMASAARQHRFPERDERCRITWNRYFR